jgi:hypothetical protein
MRGDPHPARRAAQVSGEERMHKSYTPFVASQTVTTTIIIIINIIIRSSSSSSRTGTQHYPFTSFASLCDAVLHAEMLRILLAQGRSKARHQPGRPGRE